MLILFLLCALLLVACSKGDAAATQPTAGPAATEVALVHETPAPTAAPQEARQVVIAAAPAEVTQAPVAAPVVTATPEPTAEPTPEPTPEPTLEPKLGVLDGKFADKFVTGAPVLTASSYQTDRLAIFIERVVDESRTITNHTFVYYMADVYFQNMEDFRSGAAKSWKQLWDNAMLVDCAKKNNAIFAVSGDFTLTRKTGLVIRNGELLQSKHDEKRDVGVIYKDGHMETYLAQQTPVEEILNDPDVWQILGFGPELLDENGQPKTSFNDPNGVVRANIRNAVGYFEPGHYCFVYVQPYKTRKDGTCLDMESLSKLMYELGCVRAYNLDGGGTAGMYFNGKLVSDKGMGQTRKIHDFYYIPKA
ncbi:MAG: phosphodiester glycosidase family protein [Clostridia bacterium]|nr:phosphodiester glycosidase family protein [Clostridia bacterium]MBR0356421.1 phosphodiester glycosidase family protein [Clostridia bacterium]